MIISKAYFMIIISGGFYKQKIEDTWNMQDMYENEELMAQDVEKLRELMKEFASRQNSLAKSGEQLLRALKLQEEMNCLYEKLHVYANQKYHEDTAEAKYQRLSGEMQILGTELSGCTAWLEPELLALPQQKLAEFFAETPELADYRWVVEQIVHQREYVLEAAGIPESMEKKLRDTAAMAKSEADLVMTGSGYGALKKQGWWTEHLTFVMESDSLKRWNAFFETGVLHKPPMDCVPDEFLIDGDNLDFLVNTLETVNRENWYAYYQAGIGCFAGEDYDHAKKYLLRSWELEASAWVCHGLACTYLLKGQRREAAAWMQEGLKTEHKNVSYLKEALKILNLCGAYEETVTFFEEQGRETQEVGKLKFYYIIALHQLGEDEKAYKILEENGGIVIDDIREGEDSVAQLWSELHEKVCGVKAPVPYRYAFKAF
nr:hypothetical protein [uncultured Marvinbryantia sp.]